MLKKLACLIALLAFMPAIANAAADPAEVAAVVAAVKAANPDLKSLCQQGADGIRKAVTDAIMSLMMAWQTERQPAGDRRGSRAGDRPRVQRLIED